MADSKLSGLPSAGTLTGAELLYLDQSAASVKALLSVVATFLQSAPTTIRTATASPVTITTADKIVFINVAAPVTVNLPASNTILAPIRIMDISGNAAANPITIVPASGTINLAATLIMAIGFESVSLVWNGSDLSAI